MIRCIYFTSLLFILMAVSPYFINAHGVEGSVETGGVTVLAQYDSGDPMSYAKVTISAPEADLPFQSGRTDRNGRFCFFPDIAGKWEIVVDDAMGHRLALKVPVDEQLALQDVRSTPKDGFTKIQKVLLGLSLIGNIVFGTLLVRKKQ